MFRRLPCLLLVLGGATLTLAAPRVRIGVENNSAPLSFVDAQKRPAGFTADLLREMERTGTVEFEIVASSWLQILAEFRAGRLDALANVAILDERRAEMEFTIRHAHVHAITYHRPDRPALRRTADFAGKRIAVLAGSIGHANAVKNQGWGATIVVFNSWNPALEATRAGQCDAALFIRSLQAEMLGDFALRSDFVDDIVHEFHLAVHKGDLRTLETLNEALATVRHNGTFDRIYARWIGPLEPHPIRLADLRPYYPPAALGLLGVAAIIWWQRWMLRRLARKKEALSQSEERWKFALEGAGDAVWDWDIAGDQILFSHRWAEMLGLPESEIGTTLMEWKNRIHPDDLPRVDAALQHHLGGRTASFVEEHRLRARDGSYRWILSRGLVVRRDTTGRPLRLIGTHADISALKRQEQDRLVMSKLESTGRLAAGLAHDFNNLLTAIMLNLEFAEFGPSQSTTVASSLAKAKQAVLAARDLTRQLITFADGGTELLAPTSLAQPIRESVALALSGSAVRGDTAIAADLFPVIADQGQFAQVIRNLVLNAREAMPAGGVVTLRAENVALPAGAPSGLPAGDYVHISVADQGPGIPAASLPRIFDPYFSTKQRGAQKGMGLGLTICHAIVQRYGGALQAESPPGAGAVFHLYLPAHRGPVTASPPPPATADRRAVRRILIMDDEPSVRETLQKLLEMKGYEVESTADGRAAVDCYVAARPNRPFDAVLLDLTVRGGMGGLEAVQLLRAHDPAVRAIVMSGYTNDETLREHERHGFAAALVKPFTYENLQGILDRILAPSRS